MHPAIELLLARLESNPEEFIDTHPLEYRWGQILELVKQSADEEELKVLTTKLKSVKMDLLHKAIMQELCAPEQQELEYYDKGKPKTILTTKEMKKQAFDLLIKSYGTEGIK